MSEQPQELVDIFLTEAEDQLQRLDEGILALEKNASDFEILNEIFRAAHTLKGSAATMGYTNISELSHAMEELLDGIRSGNQQASPNITNALLNAADALRILVEQVKDSSVTDFPIEEAIDEIKRAFSNCAGETSNDNQSLDDLLKIEAHMAEDCAMPQARGFMVLRALSERGRILSSVPKEDELKNLEPGGTIWIEFKPSAPQSEIITALDGICEIKVNITTIKSQRENGNEHLRTQRHENEVHAHGIQTVRVGIDRLDKLMNLVGELVIDRTRIEQVENSLASRYKDDPFIESFAEESIRMGRILTELQENITKIRMLPVGQVFNRFPRMVRDVAHRSGKKIDLIISGQETELDRSVLEEIVDPLTHLIRNAISHGIEETDERIANGKSEIGLVKLSARQEENQIIIDIEDDGRGISVENVRKAAIKNGAISKEAADQMSEKECLMMVFQAGISTAEEVTDLSGRGVGLDVVKSNIERLSGKIDIETKPGKGTLISLKLPLTLAILRALIVSTGDRLFAIPHTSVLETSHRQKSDIHNIQNSPTLKFRGSALPLLSLNSILPNKKTSGDQLEEPIIVIVSVGGEKFGISVGNLIGEQEIVIKPLGSHLGKIEGISGATLMGDGKIALIVDVHSVHAMIQPECAGIAA